MSRGLRLMVYDRTCVAEHVRLGLSTAWAAGSTLYRGLGRLDATYGATSWDDALRWLATFDTARPLAEIQYWGHGRWGRVMVDRDAFDASALLPGHRLETRVAAVRERLLPDGESLVWLRTCEAFGATAGLDFAERLANGLGARVAGHTFIIGAVQSGLRALLPGHRPDWSAHEGLKTGTPDKPLTAHGSGLAKPRTVSFLTGAIPPTWFT